MSWIVVFSSTQPHIIEIVKNLLNESGISFVVIDKRDSVYTTVSEPGIEVYIQGSDFIRTKKILSEIDIQ